MFVPCGCTICKGELGETVNQLNIDGYSPNEIIEFLRNESLIISKKTLERHLSAYDMKLNSEKVEIINDYDCVPIDVNMGTFDFSKYRFNESEANEIVEYLQKLHLKIHLNQAEILMKNQEDVLMGRREDIPFESLKNIAISWKMLTDVTGLKLYVDVNSAIKRLENEGYEISGGSEEIENTTSCENHVTILENDDLEDDQMQVVKQTHKILKGILKNAGKPLSLEGIQLRLSDKDKMIKHHLIKELEMMIDMGVISRKDGYYSLVREEN